MRRRKTVRSSMVKVPQTLAEAAEIIHLVGKKQKEIKSIKATCDKKSGVFNEQIEVLNKKVEVLEWEALAKVEKREKAIFQLMRYLFAYAESHRDELTNMGKRKTVPLLAGKLQWQLSPFALVVEDEKKTIERLERWGWTNLLQVTKKIDKRRLLKELQKKKSELAQKLKDVSIVQREQFIVEPAESGIEAKEDVRKLRGEIV